jgi:tetraacyldisaccharide 4'-kinase
MPLLVDPSRHDAAEVGDEPPLLAATAPTIVSSDRVAGAQAAAALGASLVILDDGLQNPALSQDLRFAVIDGASGLGNGHCLPAGPLRAPLAGQIPFISSAIIAGAGAAGAQTAMALREAGKPVFHARFEADQTSGAALAGRRVLAFAGIGLPQKFLATLTDLGAKIVGQRYFADHHRYSRAELMSLQHEALRLDAKLVTTEKDMMRLQPLCEGLAPDLPKPFALPVRLAFEEHESLEALICRALEKARSQRQSFRSCPL